MSASEDWTVSDAEGCAWKQSAESIHLVRAACDGSVPIALICLPVAGVAPDGTVKVRTDLRARIVWLKTFPVADRGPLLKLIGEGPRRPFDELD